MIFNCKKTIVIGVKDTLLDIGANNDAKLIVFKNNDGETDGCILLLHYDTNISRTAAAFSGYISTFSLSGQPLSAVKVDDGTIVTGVTDIDPMACLDSKRTVQLSSTSIKSYQLG